MAVATGSESTGGAPIGDAESSPGKLTCWLGASALTVYCLVRYGDALLVYFFLDDFWLIERAAEIEVRSVVDLLEFFRPGHAGFVLYRPLSQVGFFWVLNAVFGYDAGGYHAVQLLAHLVNSLLVFGIGRRLSGSTAAALAVGLLYAAAPGHSGAVYWVANFCTSGTATLVFAMLWWWLRSRPPARGIGCAVLQALALLAGEQGVVGAPLVILLAVFAARREPWRRVASELAPSATLVVSYLGLKLAYLTLAPIPENPATAYALTFAPGAWLSGAGGYLVACFNVLALAAPGPRACALLGLVWLVLLSAASWRVARGDSRWHLVGLGSAVFLMALLPVLPLAHHHFGYLVGIASLGASLAVVGLFLLMPRHGGVLALTFGCALLLVDVATGERAAREDGVYRIAVRGAEAAARWLVVVDRARGREVFVPATPLATVMFGSGAERLLLGRPERVVLYDPDDPPARRRGTSVLVAPPIRLEPGQRLPGWSPSFDWIRGVGKALASN